MSEPPARSRRGWAIDTTPLRNPSYRRLFLGVAATMLGQQMTLVAVPFQVYALTHSSLLVGVTSVVALASPATQLAVAVLVPMLVVLGDEGAPVGPVGGVAVLMALRTYAAGKGLRGKGAWEPVQAVVDALDGAFYTAFGAVEPSTG